GARCRFSRQHTPSAGNLPHDRLALDRLRRRQPPTDARSAMTMATTFDLSDVPAADADDLAAAMRSLIEAGRGLVLLDGATDADLDRARAVLQRRFHADPQRALVAFVRFRHLV